MQTALKAGRVKERLLEEEGLLEVLEVFEGVDGLKRKCRTFCSDNVRQ